MLLHGATTTSTISSSIPFWWLPGRCHFSSYIPQWHFTFSFPSLKCTSLVACSGRSQLCYSLVWCNHTHPNNTRHARDTLLESSVHIPVKLPVKFPVKVVVNELSGIYGHRSNHCRIVSPSNQISPRNDIQFSRDRPEWKTDKIVIFSHIHIDN